MYLRPRARSVNLILVIAGFVFRGRSSHHKERAGRRQMGVSKHNVLMMGECSHVRRKGKTKVSAEMFENNASCCPTSIVDMHHRLAEIVGGRKSASKSTKP